MVGEDNAQIVDPGRARRGNRWWRCLPMDVAGDPSWFRLGSAQPT
jgi:hypothetical protein